MIGLLDPEDWEAFESDLDDDDDFADIPDFDQLEAVNGTGEVFDLSSMDFEAEYDF